MGATWFGSPNPCGSAMTSGTGSAYRTTWHPASFEKPGSYSRTVPHQLFEGKSRLRKSTNEITTPTRNMHNRTLVLNSSGSPFTATVTGA